MKNVGCVANLLKEEGDSVATSSWSVPG